MVRAALNVVLAIVVTCCSLSARAERSEPGEGLSDSDSVVEARRAFARGVEALKAGQSAEALKAFEHSAKLRPHPVTTFNIAVCQRALGNYTRARASLERALQPSGEERLPDDLAADAEAYRSQIDELLAHVVVTLVPRQAAVSVDGRPLQSAATHGKVPRLIAGVLPPGAGGPPPAERFELVMDPGVHVISVKRAGYSDVVVNRAFAEGERSDLELKLDELPATLRVSSAVPNALVTLAGRDMGPTPVQIRRPAGTYRVVVWKEGYASYETDVTVRPGDNPELVAKLTIEETPITKRWWFWAGAAVVVAGGVALTYAVTRPQPQAPPPDGGNTGWVANAQTLQF